MENVSVVEFVRSAPPYHVGERAGFAPAYAEDLVHREIARIVRKDAPVVNAATLKDQYEAELKIAEKAARITLLQGVEGRRAPASQHAA